jgi:hypothetical protein
MLLKTQLVNAIAVESIKGTGKVLPPDHNAVDGEKRAFQYLRVAVRWSA